MMIKDVQEIQSRIEGRLLSYQPYIEKTALEMYRKDPALAVDFLTDYCVNNGDMVYKEWRKLGETLIMKYNDGFMRNQDNNNSDSGYPDWWLEKSSTEKPNMALPKSLVKNH